VALVAVLGSRVAVWITGVGVHPAAFAVAVAAIIGSQLARTRIRVGSDFVFVGWSEVGAIAVLCLLPPIWAPFATLVAVTIALAPRWGGASAHEQRRAAFQGAVLIVGTSVAAAVAGILADPSRRIEVSVDRPVSVIPLVLACTALFLVKTLLMSAWLAATAIESTLTLWRQVVLPKRTMMAGTAAVGSATAVVIGINVGWLAALAPVLWALHRVHEHQRQMSQDRTTWATLAEATRDLNQLDEQGVALAALRGAARLFRPDTVEVTLVRPLGSRRTSRASSDELLAGSAELSIVDESIAESATVVSLEPESVASRRLTIGSESSARSDYCQPSPVGDPDEHVLSIQQAAASPSRRSHASEAPRSHRSQRL
jgi:hypothetical protein